MAVVLDPAAQGPAGAVLPMIDGITTLCLVIVAGRPVCAPRRKRQDERVDYSAARSSSTAPGPPEGRAPPEFGEVVWEGDVQSVFLPCARERVGLLAAYALVSVRGEQIDIIGDLHRHPYVPAVIDLHRNYRSTAVARPRVRAHLCRQNHEQDLVPQQRLDDLLI